MEQIAARGVVLSEFPPQFPPNSGTFPTRNRIIAGLSRGVIIVEAGKKSGALITSTYALEYNRDVFAIPGQIYAAKSQGCNELIRDGATLIKSAQDVLNEYDIKINAPLKVTKPVKLEGVAAKIFDVIPSDAFITEDEILMQVEDVNPSELTSILLELDMKGCVVEDAGRYKRK